MSRRKRPLKMEEITSLVAEDIDADFLDVFDDSDSSTVSDYTDTESKPSYKYINTHITNHT